MTTPGRAACHAIPGGLLVLVSVLALTTLVAACSSTHHSTATPLSPKAEEGQALATKLGCAGCHTADGHSSVGPTWKGIWGSTVTLSNGSTATVDAAYVRRSIATPSAQVVKGYSSIMPPFTLAPDQVTELTAYIKALR